MICRRRLKELWCFLLLVGVGCVNGQSSSVIDPTIQHDTAHLGGADYPSSDDLVAMHKANYVFRGRDGKLTRVTVEKSRLPFDDKFHPQGGLIYHARDDLIYVRQVQILSKSTDGGRSWTSREITPTPEGFSEDWAVLHDGTFVRVTMKIGPGAIEPAKVFRSNDEAETWTEIGSIPTQVTGGYEARYSHWAMTKLRDETLFLAMDLRDEQYGGERFLSAGTLLVGYRSRDGGKTWRGPIKICEWVAEGGMTRVPSGRLLASVRYQRGPLPTDTPAIRKITNKPDGGFKHHFLIESDDDGLTWGNLRPLTTIHGQCYGYPAAQSDGTVVVIHDTRYGPGPDAARAMISHDEGRTWEDEVYYLYFDTGVSSYSRSVVLGDDTILTVGGTSSHPGAKQKWTHAIGHSNLTAIRWKPVKE